MLASLLVLSLFVLLCSAGAYFIANSICQRRWKEKIPQSKLIGFTVLFVIIFITLALLMAEASLLVFGR